MKLSMFETKEKKKEDIKPQAINLLLLTQCQIVYTLLISPIMGYNSLDTIVSVNAYYDIYITQALLYIWYLGIRAGIANMVNCNDKEEEEEEGGVTFSPKKMNEEAIRTGITPLSRLVRSRLRLY